MARAKQNLGAKEFVVCHPMANKEMRQTSQTFHEWANIRGAPFEDFPKIDRGPNAGTTALTNAVTLQHFEEALSQQFAKDKKTKDADKIFPRECRIQHLKIEAKNSGSTDKPEYFDNGDGDAQWKHWVSHNFKCPNENTQDVPNGLIQLADHLYESPLSTLDREDIEAIYRRHAPNAPRLQAPVTSVENSYIDYLRAHIYLDTDNAGNQYWAHRGRDATFDHLKAGISSSFIKNPLISNINSGCPACKQRMATASAAGIEREKKRKVQKEANKTAGIEEPARKRRNTKNTSPQQQGTSPSTNISVTVNPQNNAEFDPNLQMNVDFNNNNNNNNNFSSQNNDSAYGYVSLLANMAYNAENNAPYFPQQYSGMLHPGPQYTTHHPAPYYSAEFQQQDNAMAGFGSQQNNGFGYYSIPQGNNAMDDLNFQQHNAQVNYFQQQNNIVDGFDGQQNNDQVEEFLKSLPDEQLGELDFNNPSGDLACWDMQPSPTAGCLHPDDFFNNPINPHTGCPKYPHGCPTCQYMIPAQDQNMTPIDSQPASGNTVNPIPVQGSNEPSEESLKLLTALLLSNNNTTSTASVQVNNGIEPQSFSNTSASAVATTQAKPNPELKYTNNPPMFENTGDYESEEHDDFNDFIKSGHQFNLLD